MPIQVSLWEVRDGLKKKIADAKPTGEDLANEAMQRVARNADANEPGWTTNAISWIDAYARKNPGRDFTCVDVRGYAKGLGFVVPHDNRAWGSPMKEAAKLGIIRKNGATYSTDPKHHKGYISNWRSLY